MKRSLKAYVAALTAASTLALTACGGGGGGSYSTGGTYLTHGQVAAEFVRRVNLDLAGYDLELVKTYTLQSGYIVVYDWDYNEYDAYYIGAYNVGEDLGNYLRAYESWFYWDLTPESGNYYRDWYTGVVFEKVEATGKDLETKEALREELVVNRAAEKLRAQYGLSVEKSKQAASFAYKLKTAPEGTYNEKDFDAFAKEFTGSSITEFQEDYKNDNVISLAKRIEAASEATGMGLEGVNHFINDVFVK